MTRSPMQVAKREIHTFFFTRPVWIGTVGAGLLLGLAGPFGTLDVLPLIPRMLYWAVIAVMTFLTGSIVDEIMRPSLSRFLPVWLAVGLASVVTACAITTELLAMNALLFSFVPDLRGAMILAGNVYAASLIISGTLVFIGRETAQTPTPPLNAPRILDRIPLDKRGALISLSALDHYVEIVTSNGTELILMRLSDAISETEPVEGLILHRSHWAARDQITSVARANGKGEVTLTDGRTLPVSRSNLSALKDAGLLPG
ncbi:MAG: LytTR family DNA-binding domain-containing protein [Pseudomonadota bacterium]